MNKINEMFVCEITATYKKNRTYNGPKVISRLESIKLIRNIIPKKTINHFESFGAVFLDSAMNVKGYKILSTGGISTTTVDLRILFQHALLCNSVQLLIFHNHPSGNIEASKSDIEVSKQIKKAGINLGIKLLDSIIITESNHNFIKF